MTEQLTLREVAKRLHQQPMQCNCDLDNWEPERSTGHSSVCRIHKAAFALWLKNGCKEPIPFESTATQERASE